jgi:hypothetical protein
MPNEHQLNMECRKEVRKQLAMRAGIALTASALVDRCEGGFDEARIKAACDFLVSRGHVEELTDRDGGGERFYKITADGTVAYENGN